MLFRSVAHCLRRDEHPIFDIRVFGDLNFSLGCLVMGATGVAMFGGNFLQPLFLDNLLGYPAMTAGLVLMARGVGSLVSMSFSGRFADRVSAKWVALPGVLLGLAGSYMMTGYSTQVQPMDLLLPLFLQGVGIGLIWVPISALAFSTIPQEKSAEASGVYSLVRSITSAMGVSITSTFLAREIEMQWSLLRGQINPKVIEPRGLVAAMNVPLNRMVARFYHKYDNESGVLATGGGLVFTATLDGNILALNDETLQEIWRFNTGMMMKAAPISFAVNGKQYIAVVAGGEPTTNPITSVYPDLIMNQGAAVYVFTL